jgi:dual-specificity kinase
LVFELLAISLSDFLKEIGEQGLLLRDIQIIARQVLQCLSFLHALSCTHTDIKCRNVMLRDKSGDMVPLPRKAGAQTRSLHSCDAVVIDFGGAVFKQERHGKRIGTRQYRAPEVVMRLPWDEKADVWSLGCVLLTLYAGERPFPVHDNLEHLVLMERFLGCELPRTMLRNASTAACLPDDVVVDKNGRLQSSGMLDREAQEMVDQAKLLRDRVLPQHEVFLTFLEGLFRPDPKFRCSANEAMLLPFVANITTVTE